MTATYAQQKLTLELLPRVRQNSRFDWWDLDCGHQRIGKVKGLINESKLTIHSIYISPKFERNGFASEVVIMFKSSFDAIIADGVRHSAKGFWEKMGFEFNHDGNCIWISPDQWQDL